MKILWFSRIQPDINKLHLTTWREMCKEFEALGCMVRVAVTGDDPENILDRECIKVFEIKKKVLRLLSYWISGYTKFIVTYLKFRPDFVILDIYSIWFSIPFVFLPLRKTVFIIDDRTPRYCRALTEYTCRDGLMKFYTKLSYKFCNVFLDGMTVITGYYKKFVHDNFRLPYSSLDVWGSGVDVNKFHPYKNDVSKRPSFLKDKFVVMQHGEFSNNRGLMETVEAISLIKKENICLLLIGEGTFKKNILEKIKELDIEENIHILPPVRHSDMPEYIGYCDCAIMAYPDIEYWNNNNPIKLIEYLAMGRVVICTDMWTFRDVGGDSNCIYYIEDNNPKTIADAIYYLYTKRDLLGEWGKEGVEIVRSRYTWRNHARTVLDFGIRLQNKLTA